MVEAHPIRCSHFDAFRFFTPAVDRNRLQPTRETQPELEQPGCLHAGMDLYKWAYKLSPATPGELVADCFELAVEIRELDMRASPATCASTATSRSRSRPPRKAAYVAAQRSPTAGRLQHASGPLRSTSSSSGRHRDQVPSPAARDSSRLREPPGPSTTPPQRRTVAW